MDRARVAEQRWKLLMVVSLSAAIVLVWKLGALLIDGWAAIRYPYQLDYGEGIVWQQMRSIVAGDGYAPLDGFPDIVFHYPPLYHLTSWVTSELFGLDQLAAGRLVSFTSTLTAAALAGLIAARLVPADVPRRLRLIGAAASSLMVLSLLPIQFWAPLMRVDMLALALVFGGVLLSFRALERSWFIHLAAVAFVAAVYTKQSMIAAPAAVFLVLLFARPRLALAGIGTSLFLGLIPLVILTNLTDGGFLRHIFLYNVNRFNPARLLLIPMQGALHGIYLLLAALGVAAALRPWRNRSGFSRTALASDSSALRLVIVLVHFVLATMMALMIGKSGSGPNYLAECLSIACIFAGVTIADAFYRLEGKSNVAYIVMALAITFQAAVLPTSDNRNRVRAEDPAEREKIAQLIREAQAPVISDDMVLLLRNDHDVLWESAIFAELSGTRRYDLRPFIAKVHRREFAFFVVDGEPGEDVYELRYPPALSDAIDTAYPIKLQLAGLVVQLPPDRGGEAIGGRAGTDH